MITEFDNEREEWLNLAPLYLNGSLQGEQRMAFEQALQDNMELQKELLLLRTAQAAWESEESNKADFDTLFTRIEPALNADTSPAKSQRIAQKKETFLQNTVTWLSVPQLAWSMVAAQFCLIAFLLAGYLTEKNNIDYRILTGLDGIHNPAPEILLDVMFTDDAKLQQVGTLLHNIKGRIIDGPTVTGRIVVALTEGGNQHSVEKRVAALRESDLVSLAVQVQNK